MCVPKHLQVALSPEDAAELEEVDHWVQMMADFEESEGDHLIALAMRFADKSRIQDVKQRAAHAGMVSGAERGSTNLSANRHHKVSSH